MSSYHPRGINFEKLEKSVVKGEKYYLLKYWTDLVAEENYIRRVEYLDLESALTAYQRIKDEGSNREHGIVEYEFRGDTWDEHLSNMLPEDGTDLDPETLLLNRFHIKKTESASGLHAKTPRM